MIGFEWDDTKAAKNWRDHRVTFEMAREAFDDAFAIEWADNSQDDAEERFALIGMVQNRLLFVAYSPARAQDSHYLSPESRTP